MVIGFEQPSYTVNEQAGTLDVAVRIMSGQLRIPIMVNFSTIDGSALGKTNTHTHTLVVNTLGETTPTKHSNLRSIEQVRALIRTCRYVEIC